MLFFFKLRFFFWGVQWCPMAVGGLTMGVIMSFCTLSTGNRNGTGQIALQDQSWTNKSDLIVDGRNQPETLKPWRWWGNGSFETYEMLNDGWTNKWKNACLMTWLYLGCSCLKVLDLLAGGGRMAARNLVERIFAINFRWA